MAILHVFKFNAKQQPVGVFHKQSPAHLHVQGWGDCSETDTSDTLYWIGKRFYVEKGS